MWPSWMKMMNNSRHFTSQWTCNLANTGSLFTSDPNFDAFWNLCRVNNIRAIKINNFFFFFKKREHNYANINWCAMPLYCQFVNRWTKDFDKNNRQISVGFNWYAILIWYFVQYSLLISRWAYILEKVILDKYL